MLDLVQFQHQDPTIEFDIEEVCSGEAFTGTMRVIGAGGSSTSTKPMDVVLAIDTSGSMGGTKLDEAKAAAISFVETMADEAPASSMVGVVGWTSLAHTLLDLTDPRSDLTVREAINNLNAGGSTNLDNGIKGAIQVHDNTTRLSSDPSSKAIVFLTDGDGPYTSCADGSSVSAEARDKGIVIYSIGFQIKDKGVNNLQDMADCTGGLFKRDDENSTITDIYQDIYQAIEISTVPHNIRVDLLPAEGVKDLRFDLNDPHISTSSAHVLENIDDGTGLMAGEIYSCDFQGVIAEDALPTVLTGPDSEVACKDKDGTEFQRHALPTPGTFKISNDCDGTDTGSNDQDSCDGSSSTKSSSTKSSKSSVSFFVKGNIYLLPCAGTMMLLTSLVCFIL